MYRTSILSCMAAVFLLFFQTCVPLVLPADFLSPNEYHPAIPGLRLKSWSAFAPAYDNWIFMRGEYTYRDDGYLDTEVRREYRNTGELISELTSTFNYDEDHKLISITLSTGTSSSTSTYTYDDEGRLITSASGNYTISYSEDGLLSSFGNSGYMYLVNWLDNRVSSVTLDDTIRSYSYNDLGQCTRMSVSSPAVKSVYTYDERGFLVRRTFYDEVSLAYHQDYVWEPGFSPYNFMDVSTNLMYQFGWYFRYGLP